MAKLDRNRLMFFASFDGTNWEVLGKDNDDLSKELNPDTETSKNVLGESTFNHSGYEPEVEVDPYYADPSSVLYEKLIAAAMQEKYGDSDIKGYFVEVIFSTVAQDGSTMSGTGYKREAYIVPQSTGGDTAGLGIPFTVNPVGAQAKKDVVYTRATRAVTVSAATTQTYTEAIPDEGDNPMALGWFEKFGTASYFSTTDTAVVDGKTYYELDEE